MLAAVLRALPLAALLIIIWLLLSGHFTPLLLGLGAASIGLILWLSHRMDDSDDDPQPVQITAKMPAYWLWLVVEILKANLDVIKRVFAPISELKPVMADVVSSQKTGVGRVTYANSITLTPGTIAMQIDEEKIQIHAISQAGADDLEAGDMDQRVIQSEPQSDVSSVQYGRNKP